MRIARFAAGDEVGYGVVGEARGDGPPGARAAVGEQVIAPLGGHPFGPGPDAIRLTGTSFLLNDVRLLAPVLPSKVIAVGENYADHAREMGGELPAEPVLFLKPSTAVCGTGDPIQYPVTMTKRVDYEGELAIIIGRLCRDVPASQAYSSTTVSP